MNITDVPPLCTAVEFVQQVQCMLHEGHTKPHDSMVGVRWAVGGDGDHAD